MKIIIRLIVISFICTSLSNGAARIDQAHTTIRVKTEWQVISSFKYDTLCFLNVLTGDSFYQKFYADEFARFDPRNSPKARTALANIKRILKDENKNIVSAFLSLHFSATDAETLDEMSRSLDDSNRIKANLQNTVYYNKDAWKLFKSVEKDLKIVFQYLKTEHFDVYWQEEILPRIKVKTADIGKYLSNYDVIPEIEKHLGFNLTSTKIVVYVLYFSRPHGMKLTGARFVTDVSYPFDVVLRIAIHELLHPPYDLSKDKELRKALDTLRTNKILTDKIRNHNPSFGYNSFESFVEEDCVRALDQIIGEQFGLKADALQRFKDEDEGMHVFAAALYNLMKHEKYEAGQDNFRNFLLKILRSGKLLNNK
jgi:hypothetical protein